MLLLLTGLKTFLAQRTQLKIAVFFNTNMCFLDFDTIIWQYIYDTLTMKEVNKFLSMAATFINGRKTIIYGNNHMTRTPYGLTMLSEWP